MSILTDLLKKRGLKPEDLDTEEKLTLERWRSILDKEELTLEDIKKFCASQVEIIESKWSNYDLENSRKAELIPFHTVYRCLLVAIDSPRSAREALEKHLTHLIK